jgi:S-adenosylmethionine hydrolase
MVITLLSDFGYVYPASMKGVILSVNPEAIIVDISHTVPSYDAVAGAFILKSCAKYFPSCTVHIAVVDPGVGTQRRPLAIRAESSDHDIHFFIGPDNGILIPAARSIGEFEVYEITNRDMFRSDDDISSTFHGRDIFAPAGAHITKGIDIRSVGNRIQDFNDMDFGESKIEKTENSILGKTIFIDPFGNIITNIPAGIIDFIAGDILKIGKKQIKFMKSYGYCKIKEPLSLIGSHGYLEIAINQGNAARYFHKKSGDKITIRKIT